MKIEIESTNDVVHLDGVECRVWRGVGATGFECLVFVHRVVLGDMTPAKGLVEQSPPQGFTADATDHSQIERLAEPSLN